MLIDFEYIQYIVGGQLGQLFEYKLTDSEFGGVYVPGDYLDQAGPVAIVIVEYSKRGLNVAANLVQLFLICAKSGLIDVEYHIRQANKCIPMFQQYKDELDKYMVLL